MEGLISTRTLGLIELVLTFGGVLAFCAYQIWTVRRPARPVAAEPARPTGDVADECPPLPRGAHEPDGGRRGMR